MIRVWLKFRFSELYGIHIKIKLSKIKKKEFESSKIKKMTHHIQGNSDKTINRSLDRNLKGQERERGEIFKLQSCPIITIQSR